MDIETARYVSASKLRQDVGSKGVISNSNPLLGSDVEDDLWGDLLLAPSSPRALANETGPFYWVPDPQTCYAPATLIREDEVTGNKTFELLTSKKTVQVGRDESIWRIYSLDAIQKLEDDLVHCEDISEATILWNVQQRFKVDRIYTYIGSILLSVNPFHWLRDLYSTETLDRYLAGIDDAITAHAEQPAHIFSIARQCYIGLKDSTRAQAVIISGESGAGKTEATRKVLEFLAAASSSSSHVEAERATETRGSIAGGVAEKLLNSNSILEAFGNAKTVRNDNSSRFGKWIEVTMEQEEGRGREGAPLAISGSANVTYLLEKSRVVRHTGKERNYHAFYQLCSVQGRQDYAHLNLQSCSHFHYLRQGGCQVIDGVDDEEGFNRTNEAMQIMGIPDDTRSQVWRIMAAILHTGNLRFEERADGHEQHGDTQLMATSAGSLATASDLLGVDADALEFALRSRQLKVKDHITTTWLSHSKAEDSRDALAKCIFERLFSALVQMINESMMARGPRDRVIGILDIFGFEIFEKNSFEQLCINYCNEKLQEHFMVCIFKAEQALYQAEGVLWEDSIISTVPDNSDVLELLECKRAGLLALLDEEVTLPKGSDQKYVDKVHRAHASSSDRYSKHVKMAKLAFCIRHYAGDVPYDTEGFVAKNADHFHEHLTDLLGTSTVPMLASLFPSAPPPAVDTKTRKAAESRTISSLFRSQLSSLMATLRDADPFFVRCVKPNSMRRPAPHMDVPLVLEQLRYSGVLQAVQVMKQGYPHRKSHRDFFVSHAPLLKGQSRRIKHITEMERERCVLLIEALKRVHPIFESGFQVGHTLVLYQTEAQRLLTMLTQECRRRGLFLLQRAARGYVAQKRIVTLRARRLAIRHAIETRSLEDLSRAIEDADGYRWPEVIRAEALRDLIMRQNELRKDVVIELEGLKEQGLDGRDLPALHQRLLSMLDTATGPLGMAVGEEEPVLVRASEEEKGLRAMAEAVSAMRVAVEGTDLHAIEQALGTVEALEAEMGVFCSAERELARQWVIKLKQEEGLLTRCIKTLSTCLLSTCVPPSESEPSERVLEDLAHMEAVVDPHVTTTLSEVVTEMEQFGLVGKKSKQALEQARLVVVLRNLAWSQDWPGLLEEMAKLDDRRYGDMTVEKRAYEALYARHVLLFPLRAALEEGRVVGKVGEVIASDIDLQPLQDALLAAAAVPHCSRHISWYVRQGEVVLAIRAAWQASEWGTLEAVLEGAGQLAAELHVAGRANVISKDVRLAQDEVSDRHRSVRLRKILEEDLKAGCLLPAQSREVSPLVLVSLRAEIEMAEQSPASFSRVSRWLLRTIDRLETLRDDMEKQQWAKLYEWLTKTKIVYGHEEGGVQTDENGGLSVVLDTCVQPLIQHTTAVVVYRHTKESLREAMLAGPARGSVGHLDLQAVETDRLLHAVQLCHQLPVHHATPQSQALLDQAVLVAELRAAVKQKGSDDDSTWHEVEATLHENRVRIEQLLLQPPAENGDDEDHDADPIGALREVKHFRAFASFHRTRASLSYHLLTGGPSGLPDAVDTTTIATEGLQAAVVAAQQWLDDEGTGSDDPTVQELSALLQVASVMLSVRRDLLAGRHAAALATIEARAAAAEQEGEGASATATSHCKHVEGLLERIKGAISHLLLLQKFRDALAFRSDPLASIAAADEALAMANKYGCRDDEACRFFVTVTYIREVRVATHANDVKTLKIILERCAKESMCTKANEELADAKEFLQSRQLIADLEAGLMQGRLGGWPGALDTSQVDFDNYKGALEAARAIEHRPIYLQHLLSASECVHQVRHGFMVSDMDRVSAGLRAWREAPGLATGTDGEKGSFWSLVQEEITLAESEVFVHDFKCRVRLAMVNGAIRGTCGALDQTSVRWQELEDLATEHDREASRLDLPVECRRLVSSCRLLARLRRAVRASDWVEIVAILDEVDREHVFGDSSFCQAEVELLRHEYANNVVAKQLTTALISEPGGSHSPVTGVVVASDLQKVMEHARCLPVRSNQVEGLLCLVTHLLRMRAALSQQPSADWGTIRAELSAMSVLDESVLSLVKHEVDTIREQADSMLLQETLLDVLSRGAAVPGGKPGSIDVSTVRTDEINGALGLFSAVSIKHTAPRILPEVHRLAETARTVSRMRSSLCAAYGCGLDVDAREAAMVQLHEAIWALRGGGTNESLPLPLLCLEAEVTQAEAEVLAWTTHKEVEAALKAGQGAYLTTRGAVESDKLAIEQLRKSLTRADQLPFERPSALEELRTAGYYTLAVRECMRDCRWAAVRDTLEKEVIPRVHALSCGATVIQELQYARYVAAWQVLNSALRKATAPTGDAPTGDVGEISTTCIDVSGLEEALAYASRVAIFDEYDGEVACWARLLLQLRKAQATKNAEEIGRAVKAILEAPTTDTMEHRVGPWRAIIEEARRQDDELLHGEVMAALVSALTSGAVQGWPLELDVHAVRVDRLEAGLALVSSLPRPSSKLKLLQRTAETVLLLRTALLRGVDEEIHHALDVARSLAGERLSPLASTEIDLVRLHVANKDALTALQVALTDADMSATPRSSLCLYNASNLGEVDMTLETMDLSLLDKAMVMAEALVAEGAAHQKVKSLMQTAGVIRHLRASLQAGRWHDLQLTIDKVDKSSTLLTAPSDVKAEIEVIRFQLQVHDAVSSLRKALKKGRALCHGGLVDAAGVNASALELSLVRLRPLHGRKWPVPSSKSANNAYSRMISRTRRQVEGLLQAGQDALAIRRTLLRGDYLQAYRLAVEALSRPDTAQFVGEELQQYAVGLQQRLRFDHLLHLLKAQAARDDRELDFIVRLAFQEGMHLSPDLYYVMSLGEAMEQLKKLRRNTAQLHQLITAQAKGAWDLAALETVLKEATILHLWSSDVDTALRQLAVLQAHESSLRTAILSFDPLALQTASEQVAGDGLNKAKIVGHGLGLWLIKLQHHELLQLQLSLALLDAPFEQLPDILYQGITQGGWGRRPKGLDFAGVLKEVGIDGLSNCQNPISRPLTPLQPALAAVATRMFESHLLPLEVSGDSQLAKHRQEIVRLGVKLPRLRDEIYCQIIMQLRGRDPAASAVAERALWEVLCRCLEAFPPSAAMETPLEAFLWEQGRHDLLGSLYLRLLGPMETWRGDSARSNPSNKALLHLFHSELQPAVGSVLSPGRGVNNRKQKQPQLQQNGAAPREPLEERLTRVIPHGKLTQAQLLQLLAHGPLEDVDLQALYFILKGTVIHFIPSASLRPGFVRREEVTDLWERLIETKQRQEGEVHTITVETLADLIRLGRFELELAQRSESAATSKSVHNFTSHTCLPPPPVAPLREGILPIA